MVFQEKDGSIDLNAIWKAYNFIKDFSSSEFLKDRDLTDERAIVNLLTAQSG